MSRGVCGLGVLEHFEHKPKSGKFETLISIRMSCEAFDQSGLESLFFDRNRRNLTRNLNRTETLVDLDFLFNT